MAWKKLTGYFAVFLCRFLLFLIILILSWLLLGKPNINTSFLTVFISFLIPFPQALNFINTFNYTRRVERVYIVGSTAMRHAVQVSFPHFNFYSILLGWLDFILSPLINRIRFGIPQLISKIISTVSRAIGAIVSYLSPWLRTLIILIRSFLQLLLRIAIKLIFKALRLLYRLIPSRVAVFLGRCLGVYPVAFAFFLCLPSLEILPNVFLTGNFYPGSLIRFQRCAMYEDGTACHATFLEFSYTLWNLIRTAIFMNMCWNMNRYAWKQPESDYSRILVRCLMLNNNTYMELLFCAAVMPILLDGHCFLQTLHNTFCVLNLLCFIITLNGYHKRTVIMVFYTLCGVVTNVQSVLVSLYNVYRNLQTQRNGDFVVTLMYIVELYLMFLVLFDCSSRVINKVLNPRKDIMV